MQVLQCEAARDADNKVIVTSRATRAGLTRAVLRRALPGLTEPCIIKAEGATDTTPIEPPTPRKRPSPCVHDAHVTPNIIAKRSRIKAKGIVPLACVRKQLRVLDLLKSNDILRGTLDLDSVRRVTGIDLASVANPASLTVQQWASIAAKFDTWRLPAGPHVHAARTAIWGRVADLWKPDVDVLTDPGMRRNQEEARAANHAKAAQVVAANAHDLPCNNGPIHGIPPAQLGAVTMDQDGLLCFQHAQLKAIQGMELYRSEAASLSGIGASRWLSAIGELPMHDQLHMEKHAREDIRSGRALSNPRPEWELWHAPEIASLMALAVAPFSHHLLDCVLETCMPKSGHLSRQWLFNLENSYTLPNNHAVRLLHDRCLQAWSDAYAADLDGSQQVPLLPVEVIPLVSPQHNAFITNSTPPPGVDHVAPLDGVAAMRFATAAMPGLFLAMHSTNNWGRKNNLIRGPAEPATTTASASASRASTSTDGASTSAGTAASTHLADSPTAPAGSTSASAATAAANPPPQPTGFIIAGGLALNALTRQHPVNQADADVWLVGATCLDAATQMLQRLLTELARHYRLIRLVITERAITITVDHHHCDGRRRTDSGLRVQISMRCSATAFEVVNAFDFCGCMVMMDCLGRPFGAWRFCTAYYRGMVQILLPEDESPGDKSDERCTRYLGHGWRTVRMSKAIVKHVQPHAADEGFHGGSGGGNLVTLTSIGPCVAREAARIAAEAQGYWWGRPADAWRRGNMPMGTIGRMLAATANGTMTWKGRAVATAPGGL